MSGAFVLKSSLRLTACCSVPLVLAVVLLATPAFAQTAASSTSENAVNVLQTAFTGLVVCGEGGGSKPEDRDYIPEILSL